jgi:hypothetical protein
MIKRTIIKENSKAQIELLRDVDLHNSPMGDLFSTWPALNAISLEIGGHDARHMRFERVTD